MKEIFSTSGEVWALTWKFEKCLKSETLTEQLLQVGTCAIMAFIIFFFKSGGALSADVC